jgi:hypothetical protein
MRRALLVVGLLLAGAVSAPGQGIDTSRFSKVLVPVLIGGWPGRFGAVWSSSFTVYNGTDATIEYLPLACPVTCPSMVGTLEPHTAEGPHTGGASGGGPPGVFFWVQKDAIDRVAFDLRVKDLSRQEQSEGAAVPVVPVAAAFTGTAELLNVPTDVRFRVTLRVYDLEPTGSGAVTVRIVPMPSGETVAELSLPLVLPGSDPGVADWVPGYAEVPSLLARFPALASHPRVRVEVEPTTPGLRYWAYVSVANNETQAVTTIAPQPIAP